MTLLIVCGFILILFIGLSAFLKKLHDNRKAVDFALEYRNKFVEFANTYSAGTLDSEKYVWLTKSVTRIQYDLGQFGIMDYVAPFNRYHIPQYQIIVNSLPKFRDRSIVSFEINSIDDCLLRYIGHLEEIIKDIQRKIRNPIILFQEGVQIIISLPLYFLSWFGIINESTVTRAKNNLLYKILSGIAGFITFLSGLVTIILGKDQMIDFLKNFIVK